MYAPNHTYRNAGIATAVILGLLLVGAPSAAADHLLPEEQEDGTIVWTCMWIDPYTVPPSIHINVDGCIPPPIKP